MEIKLKVDPKGIASTIITAVEQGIHYWARNVGHQQHISTSSHEIAMAADLPSWAFAPLWKADHHAHGLGVRYYFTIDEFDESVRVDPDDPDVGLIVRHRLDCDAIERGLSLMAQSEGAGAQAALGKVLSGYADANEADLFIQYCLFGEEKYA